MRRISGNHASEAGRLNYRETILVANDIRIRPPKYEWKPPTQPIYPMPEFNSLRFHNRCNITTAFDAIFEIKALWEYVIKEQLHNYSEMYSQLRIPLSIRTRQDCQKHKEVFAVYDKEMKNWLVESNEPKYKYCYNGEDFEEFEVAKDKLSGNRLLLVGKYTILMQEPNLVRETKVDYSVINYFRKPVMNLIVGVPGCGKTTYIINHHVRGSLVLTSCAEGAEDIRSRIRQVNNHMSPKLRDYYRTIDSYLLHSRRQFREIWVDEALMEHPGKLFLVCLYSRCQVMYMLGDPNQLGYINRVDSVDLVYEKSSLFFKAAKTLNTSHRCPVDVMAIISCKYDSGAYSTSTVLRSMKCIHFTSLKYVPNIDGTKYLVFKQAEKKEMKKAGYNVSTIHEYQGKEAKNVVIVRMSSNLRESLYKSAAHILVGMTRHTKSLVYYTPVTDDLHQLMNTPLTDEQLRSHQKLDSRQPFEYTYRHEVASFRREEETPLPVIIATTVVSVVRWAVPVVVLACRWVWNMLKAFAAD
ncbi:hypothetical protein MSG28_010392 [Choristoneura fumiferana]|uniref:Uncharacterized protein n=1 Tax=Choristoneura fumiferana TaxID=7141 RepID=A0ACC0KL22_CHOFU|nr:hypothetical protein MSG28_010392 [Choristoneura fumiferana]